MATDDLKARIAAIRGQDHVRGCDGRKYSCDCGYEGDVDNALTEAADTIAALEAQLAARDAEIAAWLRGLENEHSDVRICMSPRWLADAIASGDYAKGQTDAQQGD